MGDLIKRFFDSMDRWQRFVTHDIWYIGRPGEEVPQGFGIKQIRVLILLVRNLIEDQLLLRAAALTFVTMLAIVPFLSLAFYVIQEFNLQKELPKLLDSENVLVSIVPEAHTPEEDNPANLDPAAGDPATIGVDEDDSDENRLAQRKSVEEILKFMGIDVDELETKLQEEDMELDDFIGPLTQIISLAQSSANPRTLGLVGVFFIIATIFGLMRNIESSFNSIWGIRTQRSWYRMLSDYLIISLILPFLMVGVLVLQGIDTQGLTGYAINAGQYVVIWLAFTGIYVGVPNTKVKYKYGLLGGIVAGTLWSLASWGYVEFMVGITKSSIFFGSFMLIPWLLTWVYFGWTILLFGAELTFAYQNEKTFAMERHAADASQAYREAVGLKAMIDIGYRFDQGTPGLPLSDAAKLWNVPMRLINDTLNQLEETGLVRRVATEPPTYQPGRSLERITVDEIVTALREHGREPSALLEDDTLRPLLESVQHPREETGKATLSELIEAYGEDHAPVTQEERQALLPEGVAKTDPEPLAAEEPESADAPEETTDGSVLSSDEKDALRDLE